MELKMRERERKLGLKNIFTLLLTMRGLIDYCYVKINLRA